VVVSHIPTTPRYNTHGSDPEANLTWPNFRKDVEAAVKNCHECQIGKKVRNKYGELPEKLAERPIAWNRVDVDLIGILTIKTPSGKK
jgi:hypothetical protein